MKKRMIAFLSALALMVGLLPAGTITVATAESTPAETYEVGYASTNLSPWVNGSAVVPEYDVSAKKWTVTDPTTTEEEGNTVYTPVTFVDPTTENAKFYPCLFSQTGNQVDWKSVVKQLHDDNGDGKVDGGDGIFATCTAVTYGDGTTDEKTVLFITTDTMKAWTTFVNDIRTEIATSDWGKRRDIKKDHIMVSSNHTHSGPSLTSASGFQNSHIDETVFDNAEKIAQLKEDRKEYYNWVVDRIVAAAKESVNDRAPATMSRGSVNATDATKNIQPTFDVNEKYTGFNVVNGNGYNDGNGYHMNAIRHYERKITVKNNGDEASVSSIYANTSAPGSKKVYDALSENGYGEDAMVDGVNYKLDLFNPKNTNPEKSTTWSTIDDADNTMYLLRFEFEDSTKDPVVFVNWRAHSTMNSSILDRSVLSGDYATGLRKTLADNGYRAAFFLGAAGNVVAAPSPNVYTETKKVDGEDVDVLVKDKMDWLYEATDKNDSSLTLSETTKTFVYGRMLAEVAKYCMDNTEMVKAPAGEISTYKTSWKAEKNKFDDALLDAALALRDQVADDMGLDLENEEDKKEFEKNYVKFISDHETNSNANKDYFPYYYRPDDGTTSAIINSRLHFNSIYSQAKTVKENGKEVAQYTSALELDAIMLGENVAFITSPNELSDYYHDFTGDITSHTTADIEAHNDWLKLIDGDYGMPFVLGYSNQSSGYIAGWLDHNANTKDYATITGIGTEGYMLYSPGTYESMTSSFAAGQGEALIDVYAEMLKIVSGGYDEQAPCQACSPDENVTWKPLYPEQSNTDIGSGHYFLTDNLTGTNVGGQWAVGSSTIPQKTCIDLRGYTKSSITRNFTVSYGSTLSIMDSKGGGEIHSQTYSNNPGGGNISVSSGGTVNLYGGTLSFTKLDSTEYMGVGVGGVVSLQGTLNMHGGTIEGADLVNSSYTSSKESTGTYFTNNGCGGAVYVYGTGKLNVYGGTITSGSVPKKVTTGTVGTPIESVGKGPCVFLEKRSSTVNISGDATVKDIYFNDLGSESLTISGRYTGTVGLTFGSDASVVSDMTIGKSNEANLDGATITCKSESTDYINAKISVYATTNDSKLRLSVVTEDTVAIAYNSCGTIAYDSLQDAVDDYIDGYIRLLKDVNVTETETETETETDDVAVNGNVYLDLAGHDVNPKVTVGEGCTLYVMDSETDDYTVEDGKYGKISDYEGNIAGVPVEATCADDGYLMVAEDDGISFHRINLQIYAMSLRSDAKDSEGNLTPGLYYKSYFSGDEKVAEKVKKFGVALSVTGDPKDSPLSPQNASAFCGFQSGEHVNDCTGTLLYGIMKTTNKNLINNRNANVAIYGRAYVLLDDGTEEGTYMFGQSVDRTLRSQVEEADAKLANKELDDPKTEKLVAMCEAFSAVTKYWDIPNIKELMN